MRQSMTTARSARGSPVAGRHLERGPPAAPKVATPKGDDRPRTDTQLNQARAEGDDEDGWHIKGLVLVNSVAGGEAAELSSAPMA